MDINEQIIRLLRDRDEKGLSMLYSHYSSTLYGISLRILRHEAFAEDCLQRSFLKIWDSIDTYEDQKSTLYTWMAQIVRNTAIDIRRLKSFQREEKTESIDALVYTSKVTRQNLGSIDAETLLKGLDGKYSEVLNGLYLQGYTQSELSEKLNIPLGTLKTRAKRAIDLIRSRLQSEKGLFTGLKTILTLISII